ncbi:hypothetical protein J2Z76_001011 [Sedimentibacter acidaminivorans]|uniref:Uncharacterized protein n=1 Tax=Sedimentibacter acidaminivorans TaxID=913099 RepID=A0ABS4GBU1_9FIRM|nr:hypothetical protein [Sedimentibacter acidaminivorans]
MRKIEFNVAEENNIIEVGEANWRKGKFYLMEKKL